MKTTMNILLGTMLFLGAGAATAPSTAMDRPENEQSAAVEAAASLPLVAQGRLSAALGRDIARYKIGSRNGELQSANPRQELVAKFTLNGVAVRCGDESLRLSLHGYGYGEGLTPVHDVIPIASGNRAEYGRGPLVEWYVNGPAGLEQGFTLAEPPSRGNGQSAEETLQIALGLSGDLTPSVDQDKKGLTLMARDKQVAMRYAGLTATDAGGKELPAWLELRGEAVFIEVGDATARYPIVIDPLLQAAKLTASDGGPIDELGVSVSISGNTLVAGAPQIPPAGKGAAYVFVKPASGWANMTQTAKLTASDGAAGDALGYSISISGNTVTVGAAFAKIGSNKQQGAAYVFVKPASGWADMTQTAKLTAADGASMDELGGSVSISGNTVVAGAGSAMIGSNKQQGAAYVFVRPASGWANMTQTAKFTASDGAFSSFLGASVSISGNTVVAGAPDANIGSNGEQGAAYIFVKPAGGWTDMTQTAKLTASDGAAHNLLGSSACISGNTVVAGASQAENDSLGAAYVFVKPPNGWVDMTQNGKLTASDSTGNAELGFSASISGNMVVVGAPNQKGGAHFDQGAAYLFVRPAGGWSNMTQTAELIASDGNSGASFGFSASISANTVAVGAAQAMVGSNDQQGAAYVFIP